MHYWLTVPNLLTLVRLALAPVVVWGIGSGRHELALALFGTAAVTDALDGALARRFKWGSQLGAYLDPMADKALLSGAYLTLAVKGILPWWFVGLIFGRDLLILAGAGAALLFTKMRKFPPSIWGKLSTVLQSVTAAAWMTRNAFPGAAMETIAVTLIWPTALATLWSGLDYARRGLRAVNTRIDAESV